MADRANFKDDYTLLKALLSVRSPSGEEAAMKDFILNHIRSRPELFSRWEVISGYPIQDCLMLKAGNPGFAIFVHMDTVGFTVRYENQLLPVGSPDFESQAVITGKDSLGEIECQVKSDTNGRAATGCGSASCSWTWTISAP